MEIRSTKDYSENGIKILCYGQAGSGKTYQIKTLIEQGFNPIVIDIEGGLLTLKSLGLDVPYISIKTVDDLYNFFQWIETKEAEQFDVIVLDSVSDLSKIILTNAKRMNKDSRQAYGQMAEDVLSTVRMLCNIPKHIYVTAQLGKMQDDSGKILYGASAEGKVIAPQLEYMFSEVFYSGAYIDEEGKQVHYLQTFNDGIHSAKDRSGVLNQCEFSIGEIIRRLS